MKVGGPLEMDRDPLVRTFNSFDSEIVNASEALEDHSISSHNGVQCESRPKLTQINVTLQGLRGV